MPGRLLETMSWDEAEAALAASPVLLLPLGARLKEHGLHLPLNNDWVLAECLARRVAERADVLVLPTLSFNYFPAFVEYPGSVSLSLDVSRDLVVEICTSLAQHGARKFYVLNTGVSTNEALAPAKEILAKQQIQLEFTHLLKALQPTEDAIRQQPGGTHADEMETSMMLHLVPHLVNMHRARPDYHEGPGRFTRDPNDPTKTYSPTGAWGDPTLATPEKGRLLVDALLDHILADIEQLARQE